MRDNQSKQDTPLTGAFPFQASDPSFSPQAAQGAQLLSAIQSEQAARYPKESALVNQAAMAADNVAGMRSRGI